MKTYVLGSICLRSECLPVCLTSEFIDSDELPTRSISMRVRRAFNRGAHRAECFWTPFFVFTDINRSCVVWTLDQEGPTDIDASDDWTTGFVQSRVDAFASRPAISGKTRPTYGHALDRINHQSDDHQQHDQDKGSHSVELSNFFSRSLQFLMKGAFEDLGSSLA